MREKKRKTALPLKSKVYNANNNNKKCTKNTLHIYKRSRQNWFFFAESVSSYQNIYNKKNSSMLSFKT